MTEVEEEDHTELLRQQTVLAQFGEFALRTGDLDEILTEACRLVGEALSTDLAKVVELQEDGHTLLVRAGVGWKPGVVGKVTIEVTENTSEGRALKSGEPMVSPDIETETRFSYPPFLVDNGVRAVANVVIIGGQGRPHFGILQVDSRKPRHFSDRDIAFLRGYANLIAAAVDRLRLHREMNLEKEALETTVAERTRQLTEANTKLRVEAEERERVEESLRQSHKMEAVGQLTGGLAHDFNNLLAGISGSLELIRIRAAQGRMADLERYIESALTATSRAAALTHRLLAFSRRQTLDPKPTDVNHMVRGMEDLLRRTVGPSIQINTKLESKLSLALCDQNQLESTLLNLVINARDAMPDGGHILLETTNTVFPDLPLEPKDGPPTNPPTKICVALLVTDTGVGMPPDVRARAFDPFFTTKPMGEGTGLGLSMVYGFVRQSGGQLQLLSEEGRGTTVKIYLPSHVGAVPDGERHDAVARPELRARSSAVVLVVEDEPPVRMVIVDVLSDLGYTVLEAGDGRSGLNILESLSRIDLLVTDVGLPGGMNGRQVADAARRRWPGLAVLFITGYAEGVLAGKDLLENGMQIITKPFSLEVFATRVQGILGD